VIHLRKHADAARNGRDDLFLAPGFYKRAETVDDLVDFIVGVLWISSDSRLD